MKVIEILLVVAFVVSFLGLSYGVKRLCRKYVKGHSFCGAEKENVK